MKSLAEQLLGCGLVSEKQFRETEAEKQLERNSITVVGNASAGGEQALDASGSMKEFKLAAKKILLQDPSAIHRIIQKAHRFKGEEPENKKFIWFFYQVRDQLNTIPVDQHPEFLRKAFRRHGSKIEIEE